MALTRRRAAKTIRELALSLPESYEDSPWGFPVFKVADNRMFAWLFENDPVEVTVKLSAEEREIAHLHPWVRVASHVGRYGWITATIEDADALETGARVAARVVLPEGAGEAARRRVRGVRRRAAPTRPSAALRAATSARSR